MVPSPNPASHNALLNVDAISAGRAWAVGYQDDGNGDRSLVERWNGSRWRSCRSPLWARLATC